MLPVRQVLIVGVVFGLTGMFFAQPISPPVEWNNPGRMELPNVTLFINSTCPELSTTAEEYPITIIITIEDLNDAHNASHADLTVHWGWSRLGSNNPSYQSPEHTFHHLTQSQNGTLSGSLYVRAVDVGIWPGQSGYSYLMLTYTIGRRIYSGTDQISSGHSSYSQNIPVTAGADAYETPLALSPMFVLGAGLIGAIIGFVHYLRKDK